MYIIGYEIEKLPLYMEEFLFQAMSFGVAPLDLFPDVNLLTLYRSPCVRTVLA